MASDFPAHCPSEELGQAHTLIAGLSFGCRDKGMIYPKANGGVMWMASHKTLNCLRIFVFQMGYSGKAKGGTCGKVRDGKDDLHQADVTAGHYARIVENQPKHVERAEE